MIGLLADVPREEEAPEWLFYVAGVVAVVALVVAVVFIIRNRRR
ncbi:hypothetical protein [Actinomadura rugatobispora]|uniref:LPXTG cell wall anchor domain-containing protein n=1 Tax=Actinomadura rugatobispora TaxID=1994 RepID=A0ABW1AGF2_9ACTN|nr:hypothetical protein GCM10010200_087650 [Actinomadura rugatobispora]